PSDLSHPNTQSANHPMSIELREVIDTVQMTEADQFDIRTVTLGISLRGCGSRSAETTRQKIVDRVLRQAEHHVGVVDEVSALYGVRVANRRIAVTPVAIVADGLGAADFVSIARGLD